jgi:membrane protease YdiL (CAAX protease family)
MPATSASRTLFIILGYIAAVLVGGALLAPVLFFAAKSVMEHSPDGALAKLLADHEFPGYFNRAAMLVAVGGLFPLLRLLRVQWSQVLGDVPFSTGWKQVLASFGLALVLIVAMECVCGWLGAMHLKPAPRWTAVSKPLLSGFSVAILEEFLFRGAMLTILCRSLGRRPGLWWTTGIFAIVHFLKPPIEGALPDDQVTWTSGFWVISQLFSGFSAWEKFVGEFLLLAAVGWVLGRARLASGGLWAGIGLHAGWVAGMKYFGQLVIRSGALDRGDFSPWMVKNTCRAIVSPIVGIIPLCAVVLTGILALLLLHTVWTRPSPLQKDG